MSELDNPVTKRDLADIQIALGSLNNSIEKQSNAVNANIVRLDEKILGLSRTIWMPLWAMLLAAVVQIAALFAVPVFIIPLFKKAIGGD